jgi:hypothetical protein
MDQKVDFLKIGKANELSGKDYKLYRLLEILPGFLSLATIFGLIIFSYFKPVWVAYFIIAFDVYWLLLVIYMAIFLITSYSRLKRGLRTNWRKKCEELTLKNFDSDVAPDSLTKQGLLWTDLWQLIILPTYNEEIEIIKSALDSLINDGFPTDQMIIALAMEERGGEEAKKRAVLIKEEYQNKFKHFIITWHPDGIEGEIKGKGANQAWCVREVKRDLISPLNLDSNKILISVFDIDTIVHPGYFYCLTYKFLTVSDPYHASYQPVPVYQNNIWNAPFFSRVAATSNTFWQMIMQVRHESLVTYSSHSMTYKALEEIGFWSTKMVSEDSRIFWDCLMFYNGRYRVEPLQFEVSMDITCDKSMWKTIGSLYKQQRRWAWGGENIPYLLFNAHKKWKEPNLDRKKIISHIIIQIYGFHAWATSALIIAVVGWMPMLLGGNRFNSTVLSGNLPFISQTLMDLAMIGLFQSAILSALLLPKRPKKYTIWKNIKMILEWVFIPVTIIAFGAIPCLEAQIRLMFGKYMGFWVTPKTRS